MAEILCTPTHVFLLTHTWRVWEHQGVLDEAGRPDFERLLKELKKGLRTHRVRGPVYLALSPELALLHTAPFPSLEGFPLDEAVLAEAQRSPLWRDEELVIDYDLLRPEGPARVWVLFAALPRDAARRLARGLRARRIEPWPLALWRAARARFGPELRYFVLEALAHTLAVFEGGRLVGFRRLSRPVASDDDAVVEEVVRSLHLFGLTPPLDRGLVFGLPEPPRLEGLPAAELVDDLAPEDLKRAAWARETPFLNLRPRRTHVGEGMPAEKQRALLLSALVLAGALAAHAWLGTRLRLEQTRVQTLEAQRDRLRDEVENPEPPLPTGPGAALLAQVARGLPKGLWLESFSAGPDGVALAGKALDPYAPLDLAERLKARLEALSKGEEGVYRWEVSGAPAPTTR